MKFFLFSIFLLSLNCVYGMDQQHFPDLASDRLSDDFRRRLHESHPTVFYLPSQVDHTSRAGGFLVEPVVHNDKKISDVSAFLEGLLQNGVDPNSILLVSDL